MDFGHRREPAADFCAEVETIEAEIAARAAGHPPTMNLSARMERAMQFSVGGDTAAVVAKADLRKRGTLDQAFKLADPRKWEWSRRDPLAVTCAHTNTVESFNATIKSAIVGVWHWFSIKHADRYLRKLAARWNMRRMSRMERFDHLLGKLAGERLDWKGLTA